MDGGEYRRLYWLVQRFTVGLLAYFEDQERRLPCIIKGFYDVEEKGGIERRKARAMWKCGQMDESIVILLRVVEEITR